jgi:glutamyl-tRNA synthetase
MSDTLEQVTKTRFSPSPTGKLHLGNARTALFSALYAANQEGVFVLRIEDTDASRSEQQFTDMLLHDLQWLGITWQEGPEVGGPHAPYWQSKRHGIYHQYYQQLESQKLAYPCFCTDQELMLSRKLQISRNQPPRYSGVCLKLTQAQIDEKLANGMKPALRFHVPEKTVIEFNDLVKGLQKFNSDDIGDFIIRRADGSSSFMFCNAIDDSLMGITHVLRGEDHLTNTPRQLMILSALKLRKPSYGHLSLIVGEDGSPLSKRHGSFSLHDMRAEGYLPSALANYLARLSHTYDSQDLMTFAQLAQSFQIERLSRSPSRFDMNQLHFWQKIAVMSLQDEQLWHWLGMDIQQQIPIDKRQLFTSVVRHNVLFPEEAAKWAHIFFKDQLQYTEENAVIIKEAGKQFLNVWLAALNQHDELKSILDEMKTQLNISGKHLFMPIRIVLTGEKHGPELAQIVTLLGKKKIMERINNALGTVC